MLMLGADWQMLGSLADWTTAGIALLAFIVAGVAARYTAQTNRAQQEALELQRRQLADAENQIRRAQASKVAIAGDLIHNTETHEDYMALLIWNVVRPDA
jgi:type II secretory pathway pseudopilin PulG